MKSLRLQCLNQEANPDYIPKATFCCLIRYNFSERGFPEDLRSNKDAVMAAVRRSGNMLYQASDELQADKEAFPLIL